MPRWLSSHPPTGLSLTAVPLAGDSPKSGAARTPSSSVGLTVLWPVAHPAGADLDTREDPLPVAATGTADGPFGIRVRKVAHAACAAVDRNDADFTACDADGERSVGIGAGHRRILGNCGAPTSPADPLRDGATAVFEDRQPRSLAQLVGLLACLRHSAARDLSGVRTQGLPGSSGAMTCLHRRATSQSAAG